MKRINIIIIFIIFIFSITLPARAISVSVKILLPVFDEKIVLDKEATIKGVVSIPFHPQKEEEAIILWRAYLGDYSMFVSTRSNVAQTYLLNVPYPKNNSAFGPVLLTAIVNSFQIIGTGGCFGSNVLQAVVLEQTGQNFEGYIVNNANPSEQDMVVGENTEDLKGCTYFIKGSCTENSKYAPSPGVLFGQPWTSDQPDHWAYWVRKSIIYANQNNSDDIEILNAVWYIKSRAGEYNQILSDIQYPANGPTSPPDTAAPAPPLYFTATRGIDKITLSWKCPSEPDLAGIKIYYRTDGAYPAGPEDGTLLLNKQAISNTEDSFEQTNISSETSYWYAAFCCDENNNYSSVAWARVEPPVNIPSYPATGSSFIDTPASETSPVSSTGNSSSVGGGGGGKAGGCFIATAAYGSYLNPHVVALTNFRDKFLLPYPAGRIFVNAYYSFSPYLADIIFKNEVLKLFVRIALTPLIICIEYFKITLAFMFLLLLFGIRTMLNQKNIKNKRVCRA